MLLLLMIGVLFAGFIAKAQDTLKHKSSGNGKVLDSADVKEKPIADSVEYISNNDLKNIYRYISDRTSGTQYFEIFLVLDNAIKDVRQKAAIRYRKKKPKP